MAKTALLLALVSISTFIFEGHGFTAQDALNSDGSIKKEFEFQHGKYFLKKGESLMRSFDAASAKIFTQCKDNFGANGCGGTWNQRYWVNNDYAKPGGPLFFMLGAEGNAEYDADGGQWLWYAQALGARCVALEHRYYGESMPTMDTSNAGMKYLSSQQALADAAKFIRWYKAQNGLNGVKTVVFGGSYGGNLVAWARELYPNDFNIGVSSSGPLNAKFDMTEYYETVSEAIYWVDSSCYDQLAQTFYCMQLIASGNTNSGCSQVTTRQQLLDYTNYCYSVNWDNAKSKANFFNWQATAIWGSNAPGTLAKSRCKSLMACKQTNSDVMLAYNCFLNSIGFSKSKCSEGGGIGRRKRRDAEKEEASFGVLDAKSDSANWFWQTCNEFGYYQGSDPRYCLFGCDTWKYNIYSDQCYSKFGSTYTEQYIRARVDQTNNYYKGTNNTGTCIIFVNGSWDPWNKLGITSASQTSSKNSVIYINTGEHCDDMSHGAGTKNQYVGQAQTQIQGLIQKYLQDPSC